MKQFKTPQGLIDLGNPMTGNLKTKHRVLFVVAFAQIERYNLLLKDENAFVGGYLLEACSFDSFFANQDTWKHQFDIVAIETLDIPATATLTGLQLRDTVIAYRQAGCKIVLLSHRLRFAIRKYTADGTFVSTWDAGVQMFGLNTGSTTLTFSAASGSSFHHGEGYPFSEEIIQDGVSGPTASFYEYTTTDPDIVFPIKATQSGVSDCSVVAYKPDDFFVMQHGGFVSGDYNAPAQKYIRLDYVIKALLGKTENIRLALDCYAGKKIAAPGYDCDTTTDRVAIAKICDAVGKIRPVGLSLVAKNIDTGLAAFYRGLTGKVSLVSHTYSHLNDRITVTKEEQVVGTDLKITLNYPYDAIITDVLTEDELTTITFSRRAWGYDIPTGANNYNCLTVSVSDIRPAGGILQFHPSRIGQTVKVSYTYLENEIRETIGSVNSLLDWGCLTGNAVYLTGQAYSIHPTSWMLADIQGISLSDNVTSYRRIGYFANTINGKMPFQCSPLFKHNIHRSVGDTTLYADYTKATAKANFIPAAIAYSKAYNLPFVWYDHDFPWSKTSSDSVWVDSSGRWNADWKKASYDDTVTYLAEMTDWVLDQLDAEGVYWMFRGEYSKRYNYMQRYLAYDVQEEARRIMITVQNFGDETLQGLTFRIPLASAPSSVMLLKDVEIDYTYVDGTALLWFDLMPGQTTVVEVRR